VPKVEKAPNATRMMVFGDSMAVDLAKALERAYAEDPNMAVIGQGVGSSGFVRSDFFDWNKAIEDQIAANAFDLAVMIIGINDRQNIGAAKPLTPEWTSEYQARIARALNAFRKSGKPVIWVGLPPMAQPTYSEAMSEVNAILRLAAVANGAEFVDTYERFADEAGKYSAFGPDLNGKNVRMRKDDGIHFSAAGADKLAFYLNPSIRLFYRGGGGVSVEVADVLAGTDAAVMVRPPFQGLGQIRLLEVAGAVIPLTAARRRSTELLTAAALPDPEPSGFDLELLVGAPVGRADAFGVGRTPPSGDVAEATP
jgi:lysophospholipase L1-like esterase